MANWEEPLIANKVKLESPEAGVFVPPTAKSGSFSNMLNYSTDTSNISNAAATKVDLTPSTDMELGKTRLQNISTNLGTLGTKTPTTESLAAASALRPENSYEKDMAAGISKLADYSSGNSQVDRTIANTLLNRFDASQSAASLSQAQRIASNPFLTTGAKQAAGAELARQASSQRSQLTGELAKNSQERAFTATQKYAEQSAIAATYNEEKFKTDLKTVTDNINREITTNIAMGEIEGDLYNAAVDQWKTNIQTKITEQTNAINAAIAIGQISQTDARIRLDALQGNVTEAFNNATLELDRIKTAANSRLIDAQLVGLADAHMEITTNAANGVISSFREKNQSATPEQVLADPNVVAALTREYQALVGDPTATPSKDWALSRISSISTVAETEALVTKNKILQLKSRYVDSGIMTAEQFAPIMNFYQLASDFGGTIKDNGDGTFDIVNATDGTAMYHIDSTGKMTAGGSGTGSIKIPANTKEGGTWADETSGQLYTMSGGKAVLFGATEIPYSNPKGETSNIIIDGKLSMTVIGRDAKAVSGGIIQNGKFYTKNSSGNYIETNTIVKNGEVYNRDDSGNFIKGDIDSAITSDPWNDGIVSNISKGTVKYPLLLQSQVASIVGTTTGYPDTSHSIKKDSDVFNAVKGWLTANKPNITTDLTTFKTSGNDPIWTAVYNYLQKINGNERLKV